MQFSTVKHTECPECKISIALDLDHKNDITCVECKNVFNPESLCDDCGRDLDKRCHTADCEEALAEDFRDGSIKPEHDSYNDAKEAYESRYGRP